MKRFVWLGSVVLVVVLLWGGAWLVLAGLIRGQVEALAANDGHAAPRLECSDLSVAGFPFRFDVACREAALQSGDMFVTAPEVRATALVYNPSHIQAFARSPVAISDAFTGSRSEVEFTDLSLSAALSGWSIGRVSLVLEAPAWSDTLFTPIPLASAQRFEAHFLDIPERRDPERGLASLAAYVKSTATAVPLFTLGAAEVEIEAEADGLPDDVRNWGADLLRRWQAAGGQLHLVSVKAREAESFIDGSGTVVLDAGGRPEGQLQFTSLGLAERIGGLVADPWRGIFVGQQQPDGTFSQTLAVRAGVIFAGLLPAGTIPPLF